MAETLEKGNKKLRKDKWEEKNPHQQKETQGRPKDPAGPDCDWDTWIDFSFLNPNDNLAQQSQRLFNLQSPDFNCEEYKPV